MSHYLDPKNDLTFKRVFGEHKHLCMSLINSMLPLENPIVSIEYQTNELIPELTDILRNTIVDVRCTDSIGRQFIVEMQLFWTESFKSRVLLNASKAYIMQMDNTEKQIKGLEFLFIELPKFKPQNRAEQKLHELWLRFLTEINEKTVEVPAELLNHEYIREAVGYMERAAYTKEQLQTYDNWKINMLTERGIIDDAREEGEAKKACIIAQNMLKDGIAIDIVCKYTGIFRQQIEEFSVVAI